MTRARKSRYRRGEAFRQFVALATQVSVSMKNHKHDVAAERALEAEGIARRAFGRPAIQQDVPL